MFKLLSVSLLLLLLANAAATDCLRAQSGHWPVLSSVEKHYLASSMTLALAPATAAEPRQKHSELRPLVFVRREIGKAGADVEAVVIAAISVIGAMALASAFSLSLWWRG